MADRMITFNVRRFDGERTFNQEYSIPYEKNTLLGCLTKIREEQDASLCFTSACRHAICGSCAVQVNGNAFLACETQLDTLLETFGTDELFLEPLNNLPVVRDLVVNFDGIADKMRKVEAWMCPHKDRKDHLQSPEQFHLIAKPADCVLCGSCISECRELAYDDGTYLPPAMMNKAYRFERDSRDGDHGKRVISYLRRRALSMGQTKSEGARHAYSFYNDVKRTGLLNETMLALRTEGMVKTAVNRTPFAVRMVAAGKMNPLHMPRPVKGIDDVRRLYEFAAKQPRDCDEKEVSRG